MTDRPSFETRLTGAFAAYADRAPTDVDVTSIVAAAAGRGGGSSHWWSTNASRRWLVPVLVGLLLLALAAGALLVGRSPSITLPVLGHVAFTRSADVYIAAADGTAANRVLQGDPNCRNNGDCWHSVGWAASGEFLAAAEVHRVVIVRPDGREVRRFEGATSFIWSPNDDRIAMTMGNHQIVVGRATADGLDALQVPEGISHGLGWGIAWAADGQSLLAPWKKPSAGTVHLWLIPADGTPARRLTNTPNVDYLGVSWSPDGSRVAYPTQVCASTEHCTGDIYVMQRDGSGLVNITNDAPAEDSPIWSPDAARIVYRRSQNEGLFITAVGPGSGSPDSAPPRRLTSVPGDWPISWGQDGRQIMFTRQSQGNYPDTGFGAGFRNEVWVIDADGSGEHLVASDTDLAAWQWLPAPTSAP